MFHWVSSEFAGLDPLAILGAEPLFPGGVVVRSGYRVKFCEPLNHLSRRSAKRENAQHIRVVIVPAERFRVSIDCGNTPSSMHLGGEMLSRAYRNG